MLPSPRLLAAARILADLTQAELATRARVSVSAVRRLEVGDTDARASTIEALAKALTEGGIEFLYDTATGKEGVRHIRPDRLRRAPHDQSATVQRKRVGGARPRKVQST
jgi:predicted transcriptional regulator